jgi:hypothetical protein
MPNLPAPAHRVHLVPPELDSAWETLDPHEEAALWAGFDGCDPDPDDDGLDTLDRLSAQIRAAEAPADEPFQGPSETLLAACDWPAELPAHLPAEETLAAAEADALAYSRGHGADSRYPYLSGVLGAYLRTTLAHYALAGRVLAEARDRIAYLESL